MASQSVEVLIEGGKATAAPPLGPALGPLGVNIGQVVADINKKTESFKGMQVPVKVTVEADKSYEISIGTPPASALIIKESGAAKGAGNPLKEQVGDLKIEQVIKIAKMKEDSLLGKDTTSRVREIVGTCQSMGILVEGKPARETLKDIADGKFDEKIASGKTELTAEELKQLQEEKKELEKKLAAQREEYLGIAKSLLAEMKGKENKQIRAKMVEAGVPLVIVNEVAPEEEKKK